MPLNCCVPYCLKKGYRTEDSEKRSYFNFPKDPILKKKWIHAIRRDVGPDFNITPQTKVCSLHFKTDDLKKSLTGIQTVKPGAIPSRFKWSKSSPRKRKQPKVRQPLASSSTVVSLEDLSNNQASQETIQENQPTDFSKEKELTPEEEIKDLRKENEHLKKQVVQLSDENKRLESVVKSLEKTMVSLNFELNQTTSRLFTLQNFSSDTNMSFYTGLPNYATFEAIFNFLDPGKNGENMRYFASTRDKEVPSSHYNSDTDSEISEDEDLQSRVRGRPRALKPIEEYFLVLCRLRRGFSEQHLAHLFGLSQSAVSKIFNVWINYMYLKFGQISIWPSKEVVQNTMPPDFKDKYPSTRVIIDCTEVKCQMPNSLLLNSEMFSSYKNNVTLKGLVGIAPNGAVTFVSQLYSGSISDREIVLRSGFLEQQFDQNDLVMVDKGFQVEDILPLGVTLQYPPFLRSDSQMSDKDVIETQQIASLRIHVERAINRIKNFHLWDGVVSLANIGTVNQAWAVCAFLCNAQKPLISVK